MTQKRAVMTCFGDDGPQGAGMGTSAGFGDLSSIEEIFGGFGWNSRRGRRQPRAGGTAHRQRLRRRRSAQSAQLDTALEAATRASGAEPLTSPLPVRRGGVGEAAPPLRKPAPRQVVTDPDACWRWVGLR